MLIQLSNGCKCFAQILPIKGKPTIVIDGVAYSPLDVVLIGAKILRVSLRERRELIAGGYAFLLSIQN